MSKVLVPAELADPLVFVKPKETLSSKRRVPISPVSPYTPYILYILDIPLYSICALYSPPPLGDWREKSYGSDSKVRLVVRC